MSFGLGFGLGRGRVMVMLGGRLWVSDAGTVELFVQAAFVRLPDWINQQANRSLCGSC